MDALELMTFDGEAQLHLLLMSIVQAQAMKPLQRLSVLLVEVVELLFYTFDWVSGWRGLHGKLVRV